MCRLLLIIFMFIKNNYNLQLTYIHKISQYSIIVLWLCTYNKQKETYFFLFACKGKNFILQKQIFKPEILQKKH